MEVKNIKINYINNIDKNDKKYIKKSNQFNLILKKNNVIEELLNFLLKSNLDDYLQLLKLSNIKNKKVLFTGQGISDLLLTFFEGNRINSIIFKKNLYEINDIDIFVLAYKNEEFLRKNNLASIYKNMVSNNNYNILKENKITTNIYFEDFYTDINIIQIEDYLKLNSVEITDNKTQELMYLNILKQFDFNNVQFGISIDLNSLKNNNNIEISIIYTKQFLNYVMEKQFEPSLNINNINNIDRFIKKTNHQLSFEVFYDMEYPLYLYEIFKIFVNKCFNFNKNNIYGGFNDITTSVLLKEKSLLASLLLEKFKLKNIDINLYIEQNFNIPDNIKQFITHLKNNNFLYLDIKYDILGSRIGNFNNKLNRIKEIIKILDINNDKDIKKLYQNNNSFFNIINKIYFLSNFSLKKLKILKKFLVKNRFDYKFIFLDILPFFPNLLNKNLKDLKIFFNVLFYKNSTNDILEFFNVFSNSNLIFDYIVKIHNTLKDKNYILNIYRNYDYMEKFNNKKLIKFYHQYTKDNNYYIKINEEFLKQFLYLTNQKLIEKEVVKLFDKNNLNFFNVYLKNLNQNLKNNNKVIKFNVDNYYVEEYNNILELNLNNYSLSLSKKKLIENMKLFIFKIYLFNNPNSVYTVEIRKNKDEKFVSNKIIGKKQMDLNIIDLIIDKLNKKFMVLQI